MSQQVDVNWIFGQAIINLFVEVFLSMFDLTLEIAVIIVGFETVSLYVLHSIIFYRFLHPIFDIFP